MSIINFLQYDLRHVIISQAEKWTIYSLSCDNCDVQVLVLLQHREHAGKPENHLQHRQPQQVQEPLQTGPHPPGQVNLEAEMVTNITLKTFLVIKNFRLIFE